MALMQILKGNPKGFCPPGTPGSKDSISIPLDVIISESPEYSATPTKTQVENGSDVTDHIALNPESVTFEAWVSNTPIEYSKIFTGATFDNLAEQALEDIKSLYRSREKFDFVGILGIYTDMVLTKFSPIKDSATGNSLHFTATIEKIVVVSSVMVSAGTDSTADGVKHTSPKTENSGHQQTKEATEKSKSLLASMNDNFKFLPGLVR
jgi:hypothetical protein